MTKKIVTQPGDRFGLLTIIELPKMSGQYNAKVVCDCGNQKEVSIYSLVRGHTQSCGCLQKKRAAEANFRPVVPGYRYGRLVAVEDIGVVQGAHKVRFLCDCGTEKVIPVPGVLSGNTQSCGCLQKERASDAATSHGHTKRKAPTLTYSSWQNMWKRCTSSKHPQYTEYGGRGIKVCQEWKTFENFLTDMGPCPDGGSIERIDVNGNYEPANCIWLERKKQAINRRVVRIIEVNGVKYRGAGEAARATGLDYKGIDQAVRLGQTRYKGVSVKYLGRVGEAA